MKALGIILAGGSNSRMKRLTAKRALAAMPIGCSYRAIDFALSSMASSRIRTVAVLSQYNTRSLSEHLNSSKWWQFGRKQGGLFVFAPTVTPENSWWYRGTADSMFQNMDFLRDHHEPYVVIASADGIYKMDFNEMLDYHIDKGADITIACAKMPEGGDASRFGMISLNEAGVITEFEEKPLASDSNLVSAGIYILRRRRLIELLERCNEEDRHNFVTGVIMKHVGQKKMYGFRMDGYWDNVSSLESYYKINMDMLRPEVQQYFFTSYKHEIYSKAADLPPTKYNKGSHVVNSLIGSGSIINSSVENSVIFKNVYVGNGSIVKDSLIMHGVYIGDNARVENCIVESNETLLSGSNYIGEGEIRVIADGHKRYEI